MPKRNNKKRYVNKPKQNNYDRQKGKDLCKQYGIRANISNDNMQRCITMYENNVSIPQQFKKLTWVQKHMNHIGIGLIGITLLASALFGYCRKQII